MLYIGIEKIDLFPNFNVMTKSNIFYALTTEDIQNVAEESLERQLTDDEVLRVIPFVENQIPWHDIINDAIEQVIGNTQN